MSEDNMDGFKIIEDIIGKDCGGDAEECGSDMDVMAELESIGLDIASLKKDLKGRDMTTEQRVKTTELLDGIEALFNRHMDIMRALDDPEDGKWLYQGDETGPMMLTFKVLAVELTLAELATQFLKLEDMMQKPFEDPPSLLSVTLSAMIVKVSLDQLHLEVHRAYKLECMKMLEGGDGSEDGRGE